VNRAKTFPPVPPICLLASSIITVSAPSARNCFATNSHIAASFSEPLSMLRHLHKQLRHPLMIEQRLV
jgi:hypothetical protein